MANRNQPIYLIANWKSNKTWAETEAYLQSFRGFREEGRVVNIICPPMPYLKSAAELVKSLSLPIKLGAQDISPFPFGTYTGAVAAGMVSAWAQFAILGHSERRKYFHETDNETANKVTQSLEQQMTPLLCVDEPYITSQLAALDEKELAKTLVVYEPAAHISDGVHPHPDDPADVAQKAEKINRLADKATIIYGGSVTADTLESFLSQPLIQGVLVGGASLDLDSWKKMLSIAAKF